MRPTKSNGYQRSRRLPKETRYFSCQSPGVFVRRNPGGQSPERDWDAMETSCGRGAVGGARDTSESRRWTCRGRSTRQRWANLEKTLSALAHTGWHLGIGFPGKPGLSGKSESPGQTSQVATPWHSGDRSGPLETLPTFLNTVCSHFSPDYRLCTHLLPSSCFTLGTLQYVAPLIWDFSLKQAMADNYYPLALCARQLRLVNLIRLEGQAEVWYNTDDPSRGCDSNRQSSIQCIRDWAAEGDQPFQGPSDPRVNDCMLLSR